MPLIDATGWTVDHIRSIPLRRVWRLLAVWSEAPPHAWMQRAKMEKRKGKELDLPKKVRSKEDVERLNRAVGNR